MGRIRLVIGDLTTANVDAIVNAANPSLLGGGGVDGAIHCAAGPALRAECKKIPVVNGVRCPFGEARITSAANLINVTYIIHTVGPIYQQSDDPAKVLSAAYHNSCALARAYKCQSIAFPAISCGVYGYPYAEAADIALTVCRHDDYRQLDIVFYLANQTVFDVFQHALSAPSNDI